MGVETCASLAVLWSGPGPARSAVFASSFGFSGTDLWDTADTIISTDPPIPAADSGVAAAGAAVETSSPGSSTRVAGQHVGRYRLIERLGRGCQGDVWRAIPDAPDDGDEAVEVALKLLPPGLARDPRRLAQFRREAERRARLAVPSVLPTSEYGEADGILFMAMPLVDGCSLAEIIAWRRRSGSGFYPLSNPGHPLADALRSAYLRGVVQLVSEVARTLDHVHSARVVHRDIKPANILLDRHRAEGIFLCDFGLGRDLDVATPEQLRDGAGTPLYMAPERLLRLPADEVRCDIYALGATLYEALTLVPPVQVPESLPWPAWTSYLATTRPSPPRAVRPDIPEALEAIVLRAMAHAPEERYPSASLLAADLERFLAQAPAGAGSWACTGESGDPAGPLGPVSLPMAAPGSASLRATEPDAASRFSAAGFATHWKSPQLAETSLSWLSGRLTRLLHPDVDAWKTPIAAE